MVYMFLANGFEEIEALCPLDLLRRANVNIKTVGIGSNKITGAHGISLDADMQDAALTKEMLSDAEMIIFPGGMPGTKNLDASSVVNMAIEEALLKNAFISAICAAPMLLGKRGLLRAKKATCYPGFEEFLEGAVISKQRVVRDEKIITAAGAGVALDFGLELVSALCGEDKAAEIRHAVIAD